MTHRTAENLIIVTPKEEDLNLTTEILVKEGLMRKQEVPTDIWEKEKRKTCVCLTNKGKIQFGAIRDHEYSEMECLFMSIETCLKGKYLR